MARDHGERRRRETTARAHREFYVIEATRPFSKEEAEEEAEEEEVDEEEEENNVKKRDCPIV